MVEGFVALLRKAAAASSWWCTSVESMLALFLVLFLRGGARVIGSGLLFVAIVRGVKLSNSASGNALIRRIHTEGHHSISLDNERPTHPASIVVPNESKCRYAVLSSFPPYLPCLAPSIPPVTPSLHSLTICALTPSVSSPVCLLLLNTSAYACCRRRRRRGWRCRCRPVCCCRRWKRCACAQ